MEIGTPVFIWSLRKQNSILKSFFLTRSISSFLRLYNKQAAPEKLSEKIVANAAPDTSICKSIIKIKSKIIFIIEANIKKISGVRLSPIALNRLASKL